MMAGKLPQRSALSCAGMGLILWAGVARAGAVDKSVVSVSLGDGVSSMVGTNWGTSLTDGPFMHCQVLSDPIFGAFLEGRCSGEDLEGERFECFTTDPSMILGLQTLPNFGKLHVYASGFTCTGMYTYHGSPYLPRGKRTTLAQIEAHSDGAVGTFYGARNSTDRKQYAYCAVYDSPGYSYTACQARDAAGDYFYCSSDEPGMVAAARALKEYSWLKLSAMSLVSSDCVEIWTVNSSIYFP